MKRTFPVFFSLIVAFVLCLQLPAQTAEPSKRVDRIEADLVHYGDVIDVDFAGTLEYDWRGTLRSDGTLDGLDQFSPITGVCRTETEIAEDIAHSYSKILREPKVTVRIVDRTGRPLAHVDGAVKKPTRFRIMREVRLKELIVATGGFTDALSGDISILRRTDLNCYPNKGPSDNGLQIINISINDLLSGRESADPTILGGDTVMVGKAVPIYVIGAVNNPRPLLSRSGTTLTRALAMAGGLAKGSLDTKVSIFRREGEKRNILRIDIAKIKNREIDDVDLRPFDIIEVAFKGHAPRKHPPVITVDTETDRNGSDLPLRVID